MSIITLTTDMGLRDHYVAAIKGRIYALRSDAKIVDISHEVKPFNISQAAFFVRNCLKDFPEGSIHIIGVDPEPLVNFGNPSDSILPLIVRYKNQYLLGSDNGIFSLILDGNPDEGIWAIEDVLSQPETMKFPTKNIFVPIACALANGKTPDDLGSKKDGMRRAVQITPVIEPNILKGSIIHIDHYGNLITNIKKEDFSRVGKNVPFTIFFRQKEYYIDTISLGYNEVPSGEKLAIFNDVGLLEIAINKGTPENGGGANTLFGMRLGDVIRIEFTPRGSHNTLESLF
jgi:S-adenosyl-L-methionine hydrolase (adenosine-forming)